MKLYSASVVPTGLSCDAVAQTRTCTNGVLSGSTAYTNDNCTQSATASCTVLNNITDVRTNNFSVDPNWIGVDNRMPQSCTTIKNNFGYDATKQAVGGTLYISPRVTTVAQNRLATYGVALPRMYGWGDNVSVKGKVKIPRFQGGSLYLGFYNHDTSGLPPQNSMAAFIFDGGSIRLRATNNMFQAEGLELTSKLLTADTWHDFEMTYDGAAGQFSLTLDGVKETFTVLAPIKMFPINLDRFGFVQSGGSPEGRNVEIYMDDIDVSWNDTVYDFATNPTDWISFNSKTEYQDCRVPKNQNFGWANGEIGGVQWRIDNYIQPDAVPDSYYADAISPVDFSTPLCMEGTIRLYSGIQDSNAHFGYFNDQLAYANRTDRNVGADQMGVGGFFGISIGGNTRDGFHMISQATSAGGQRFNPSNTLAPLFAPDNQVRKWMWIYDPVTHTTTTKLGSLTYESVFKPETYNTGLTFNRFGIIPVRPGGTSMEVYFDDLKYVGGKK